MIWQMPAPPEPRYNQQQAPGAMESIQQGLSSGLSRGLEESMGEYFDTQRRAKTMHGAADILSGITGDYELEDILKRGRELNAHPDAIQAALNLGQASQQMKAQREQRRATADARQEASDARDPMYKAAVNQYTGIVNTDRKMRNLGSSIDMMDDLIDTGKTGTTMSKVVENLGREGFGGWFQQFETDESASFNTLSKSFVEYFKQTFGARITDKDLAFINSAIPSLRRTDSQNKKILNAYREIVAKYNKEADISREIVQENGGKPPRNFDAVLAERMRPYEERVDAAQKAALVGDESSGPQRTRGLQGSQKHIIDTPHGKFEVDQAGYERYMADKGKTQASGPGAGVLR